jgi:ribosomal protein S12 methylthiotransferase
VPDLAFRTTMLVGFPGESDHAFSNLCDFVEEMEFDRLGVFEYSHEEGTTAYALDDNVPLQIKEERAARLMNIQQKISLKKNESKVGKSYKVMIDRKEGDYFYGRTEHDSPEVDNEVIIDARTGYGRIGDFSQVKIIEATEYDLYGIFENP